LGDIDVGDLEMTLSRDLWSVQEQEH